MALPYISPKITVNTIFIENGIAAGSGKVNPGNENGEIEHQWDVETDTTVRIIDWL